jgi:hypothetical protein
MNLTWGANGLSGLVCCSALEKRAGAQKNHDAQRYFNIAGGKNKHSTFVKAFK